MVVAVPNNAQGRILGKQQGSCIVDMLNNLKIGCLVHHGGLFLEDCSDYQNLALHRSNRFIFGGCDQPSVFSTSFCAWLD